METSGLISSRWSSIPSTLGGAGSESDVVARSQTSTDVRARGGALAREPVLLEGLGPLLLRPLGHPLYHPQTQGSEYSELLFTTGIFPLRCLRFGPGRANVLLGTSQHISGPFRGGFSLRKALRGPGDVVKRQHGRFAFWLQRVQRWLFCSVRCTVSAVCQPRRESVRYLVGNRFAIGRGIT